MGYNEYGMPWGIPYFIKKKPKWGVQIEKARPVKENSMWKVVIADDEYLMCEFLKKIINWEKINLECVGEASNGIQAFQLIQQLSPDIVIADVRMPGLSGLELIERCCQAGIICSFIIISGYPDFEYAKTAFTRGAVNYILKPIDEIELENTLFQVCKNIEKQKEPAHENAQTVKRRDSQIHAIDYEKQEALRRLFTRQEASLTLEKLNQQYGCCFDRELSFNVAVSNVSVQETDQETDTFLANVNARIEEQFRRHIMPLCRECQGAAEQGQLVFLLNYQPSLDRRPNGCSARYLTRKNIQKWPGISAFTAEICRNCSAVWSGPP